MESNDLFSYGPEEFEAALEELGMSEEDRLFLREEYKDRNSLAGAIEDTFAVEDDRTRSALMPMTKPKGMSSWDAFFSGEADLALPGAVTEGIEGAVDAVETPAWAASGLEGQASTDNAMKVAGLMGGVGATLPAPDDALRMFGGMGAKNFPWDRYDQFSDASYAAEVKGKSLDPDIAWEDFGIEFQPQGPVFQIDPAGATVKDPISVEPDLLRLVKEDGKANLYLDEVLDFPELWENYPKLKNFFLVVKDVDERGKPLGRGGYFDARNKEVVVGRDALKDPEGFRSLLLHELQHGVQAVEGTPGGASPSYFLNYNSKKQEFSTPIDGMKQDVEELNDLFMKYGNKGDKDHDKYVAKYQELNNLGFKKYLTNEGEVEARAAELWDNLSAEEKRTTKPSDIKRQALGLLKKEYGENHMPTTRLAGYAAGGMVKGNDMNKLFAEGGLNTGDAAVDPVSGNEVPPGSMPEEVRDDIDAKLSGGEYVVPADVLRYYGVSFFEKLRKKAKEGLSQMDSDGRIGGGGDPKLEEEDDFPFSEDDLMVADEEDDMEFAAGGAVPFNPNQYMSGGQQVPYTSNATSGTSTNANNSAMDTRTYVNAQGQTMQILFINGQPSTPIPPGFNPQGQAPAAAPIAAPGVTSFNNPDSNKSSGSEDRRAAGETGREQKGNSGTGRTWDPGVDFSNAAAVEKYVSGELNQANRYGQVGGGVGQLIGGPIGGLIGGMGAAGTQISNARAAAIVARARGDIELADKLDDQINGFVDGKGLGAKFVINAIASGEAKAKRFLQNPGATTPTAAAAATTRPANAPAKTGTSAGGKTVTKSGDGSGGQGAAKGPISGPTGGNSQKKGASPAPASTKSAPAPTKSAPAKTADKPTPNKDQGGGKPRGGRATGGLVQRRK